MLVKIAWKNILHKPLNTALCVSLLLFGVAIISLLLLIQYQVEQKFDRDLQDIDLVVGAKGSPLQLVLSAIYHLDAPTGNIKLAEARKIMESPMVDNTIPLAYGDSYLGHQILGTSPDYLEKYNAQFLEGEMFSKSMEAVLGADVAKKSGLKIGSEFLGTHGEVSQGHVHEESPYTVVGILDETNSVLDRLILTNIESVWQVHADHDGHGEDDEHHDHEEGHDHEHHDHDHEHHENDNERHDHDEGGHEHHHHGEGEDHVVTEFERDSMEITAFLVNFKTRMAMLNMPRIINQETNMQAVIPSLEINRLFYMIGVGASTIRLVAVGIMLMAGFSVFFVLYGRLENRKYELGLLRSVGYRPVHLFRLLVLEGLILAAIGFSLGWIFSRVGLFFINTRVENDFNLHFEALWVPGEFWLLLLTFLVGIVSALLPAWQAMRMDVSAALSKN